jgi:large subunit ribosomal protein L30
VAIKITLRKSLIGYEKSQRLTANALGLGKIGSSITQPDNPAIRGMVRKIIHVVDIVEAVEDKPVTVRAEKKSAVVAAPIKVQKAEPKAVKPKAAPKAKVETEAKAEKPAAKPKKAAAAKAE